MALRLNDYVVRGELYCNDYYSTRGFLKMRGCDHVINFELIGDAGRGLKGKVISFVTRRNPMMPKGKLPTFNLRQMKFQPRQVGAADLFEMRLVRTFPCSVEQYLRMKELNDPPPMEWKPCLYMSWYGQNGPVTIELVDPKIEYLEGEEEPLEDNGLDPQTGLPWGQDPQQARSTISGSIIRIENGQANIEDINARELYPKEFESTLEPIESWKPQDPEAEDIREMELLDDLMESGTSVPLASLFETPMRLPKSEDLTDEQAESALKILVGQLALHHIGFHMCKHFSPRAAYELLLKEILWTGEGYRELRGSGWTQNYMTSEYCAECDREFEEEWERKNPK